jgi:hypothetical protein
MDFTRAHEKTQSPDHGLVMVTTQAIAHQSNQSSFSKEIHFIPQTALQTGNSIMNRRTDWKQAFGFICYPRKTRRLFM